LLLFTLLAINLSKFEHECVYAPIPEFMIQAFRYSVLFFYLLIAFSCKKEEEPIIQPIIEDSVYTQYGSPILHLPASEDIIMYEINLRAFSPGGDIQGIIDKLDSLKSLSINTLWLMPIYPTGEINSVNSPYSIKDYKALSPEYGTLEDLRKLTDEAHSRDMAIILDWVANHTSWDHSWISNKNWYSQDGSGNIIHPPGTNWLDVADLNFGSDNMRLEMIDAMRYWILEANIDGYRCDYADGVPYVFWAQAIDSLSNIPNRKLILLAEGARSDHFISGFDLIYGWNFYNTVKSVYNGQAASALFAVHEDDYDNVPVGKHVLRFTTNHDESAWDQTPMVLFDGQAGAIAASVVTIFIGGAALIYTGQEVGQLNPVPFFSNSNISWTGNPEMLTAYRNILNFYNQTEVARIGANVYYPDNDIVCFRKTLNNEKLVVIVNIRSGQQNYSLPLELQSTQWNNVFTSDQMNLQTEIVLAGYEYMILEE